MSRNLSPLLVILIVLIVAVLGSRVKEGGWSAIQFWKAAEILSLLKEAPAGTLVDGFPRGLVIATDAKVMESAAYEDGAGDSVMKTNYTTAATVSNLFAGYVNYLTNQGYDLTDTEFKAGESLISASRAGVRVKVEVSLLDVSEREVRIEVRDTIK